jgi:hypothetical protein
MQELRKVREAYCFHITDSLLKERTRVEANNKAIKAEIMESRVTLDKVFDLTQKAEKA